MDNISNLFLQISANIDLPIIAIVVSSITASMFVSMVIITWKSIHENTKASYAQLLRGFHEDLTTRLNKNSVLKTTEDCKRYAYDYLNTLDKIAFLDINGKIPQGIGKYLSRFFAYGLNIIEWHDDMIGENFLESAKNNWPNYFLYCKKYDISKNPGDKLPQIMLEYNKLSDRELQ
ncbi:hypothetical protein [Nitrosopumilus sp.]|uniref:hypothetical protein n=1 Tax=Nitrosopumilus sp. TaxID=2024843 RepID=UPI0026389CFF|nr:hypothetical protein [Nitrosopumilus sp.]